MIGDFFFLDLTCGKETPIKQPDLPTNLRVRSIIRALDMSSVYSLNVYLLSINTISGQYRASRLHNSEKVALRIDTGSPVGVLHLGTYIYNYGSYNGTRYNYAMKGIFSI